MTTLSTAPRRVSSRSVPVFHTLRVRNVELLCEGAAAVTFEVPAEVAPAYAFEAGQSRTLRRYRDGHVHRRSSSS